MARNKNIVKAAARLEAQRYVETLPAQLTLVEGLEYPHVLPYPEAVWRSRHYLVQIYNERPGMKRLSINRTQRGDDGRWKDEISWDELQQIKHDVGLGAYFAYEIYPADDQVINVANIRHLWVFEKPLDFGWFPKKDQT